MSRTANLPNRSRKGPARSLREPAYAPVVHSSRSSPPERTTQQPGSEAALRRLIDEIVRGEPDYSRMGPQLAEGTRLQLPAMRQSWPRLVQCSP
jgi:hypothetical protein